MYCIKYILLLNLLALADLYLIIKVEVRYFPN